MDRRLQLQTILETLLGSRNVYFQPPENDKMKYPCIVYSRDNADTKFASNSPYHNTKRYQITYIDRDPDSPIPDKIAMLPLTRFSRHFVAESLNHDVFSTYF